MVVQGYRVKSEVGSTFKASLPAKAPGSTCCSSHRTPVLSLLGLPMKDHFPLCLLLTSVLPTSDLEFDFFFPIFAPPTPHYPEMYRKFPGQGWNPRRLRDNTESLPCCTEGGNSWISLSCQMICKAEFIIAIPWASAKWLAISQLLEKVMETAHQWGWSGRWE